MQCVIIISLQNGRLDRILQDMKNFALALFLCLTAPAAFALPGADLPENVGLYNFSTISVTTAPTQIIARNSARNYFLVQNTSATAVTIKPGSAPSSATNGIQVCAAGNACAVYNPVPALVDSFYAETASGTATLTIIEAIK